jgi:SAM-dependent methyltransferase
MTTQTAALSQAADIDPYLPLLNLMRKYGAAGSPRDFYWAVNDAFHSEEAAEYDTVHVDMFMGAGTLWKRLLSHLPPEPAGLRVLDVGCGTGLVGSMLAEFAAERVGGLVCLDPNREMLARARTRSAGWPFPTRFVRDHASTLPAGEVFDVLTVNSVMHHIVELDAFFAGVRRALRPGGVLLTAQDTRAESRRDPVFGGRARAAARQRRGHMAMRLRRAVGAAARRVLRRPYIDPLARRTSQRLMERGVIARPMPSPAVWAVTDFHVPGLEGGHGKGFEREALGAALGFEPLDWFTYQFRGVNLARLTDAERAEEAAWLAAGDPHGELFASAWRA